MFEKANGFYYVNWMRRTSLLTLPVTNTKSRNTPWTSAFASTARR